MPFLRTHFMRYHPSLELLESRSLLAVHITEFAVPTPNSSPHTIAPGSDGNVWFSEYTGLQIGRITPSGEITEFPSGGTDGITLGPDGNVWFTSVPRGGNF